MVRDTNVVVSALLKGEGLEARVVDLALNGTLGWYVSEPILTEYEGVLRRRKFPLDIHRVEQALARINQLCIRLTPAHRLPVCSHETDNRFLECAEAAGAHFLVTGNKRHFPKRWKDTVVVNARELTDFFTPALNR